MNNIKKAFDHGKAFIAFITCGDPDLETTAAAVRSAAEAGADLIEHLMDALDLRARRVIHRRARVLHGLKLRAADT